jgi:hypothetical protein
MVETRIEIANPKAPTTTDEVLLQNNDIAFSAIHDDLDKRTLRKSRTLRCLMWHERS